LSRLSALMLTGDRSVPDRQCPAVVSVALSLIATHPAYRPAVTPAAAAGAPRRPTPPASCPGPRAFFSGVHKSRRGARPPPARPRDLRRAGQGARKRPFPPIKQGRAHTLLTRRRLCDSSAALLRSTSPSPTPPATPRTRGRTASRAPGGATAWARAFGPESLAPSPSTAQPSSELREFPMAKRLRWTYACVASTQKLSDLRVYRLYVWT
jgi:hypothetical protein